MFSHVLILRDRDKNWNKVSPEKNCGYRCEQLNWSDVAQKGVDVQEKTDTNSFNHNIAKFAIYLLLVQAAFRWIYSIINFTNQVNRLANNMNDSCEYLRLNYSIVISSRYVFAPKTLISWNWPIYAISLLITVGGGFTTSGSTQAEGEKKPEVS